MPQLHETLMGRKFYERDVPELVEALKNIHADLQELIKEIKRIKSK